MPVNSNLHLSISIYAAVVSSAVAATRIVDFYKNIKKEKEEEIRKKLDLLRELSMNVLQIRLSSDEDDLLVFREQINKRLSYTTLFDKDNLYASFTEDLSDKLEEFVFGVLNGAFSSREEFLISRNGLTVSIEGFKNQIKTQK